MTNGGGKPLPDSEELMETVMTKTNKESENSVTVTSRRFIDIGIQATSVCTYEGGSRDDDIIRTLSQ